MALDLGPSSVYGHPPVNVSTVRTHRVVQTMGAVYWQGLAHLSPVQNLYNPRLVPHKP